MTEAEMKFKLAQIRVYVNQMYDSFYREPLLGLLDGEDTLVELCGEQFRATEEKLRVAAFGEEPSGVLRTETWEEECKEWGAIGDEMLAASPGNPPVAFDISQEQIRRMALRGVRPLTLDEIIPTFVRNDGSEETISS